MSQHHANNCDNPETPGSGQCFCNQHIRPDPKRFISFVSAPHLISSDQLRTLSSCSATWTCIVSNPMSEIGAVFSTLSCAVTSALVTLWSRKQQCITAMAIFSNNKILMPMDHMGSIT
ncbi:hypothetical protein KL936_002340 [Ogataea polymorpha]|nr:hypothetical protein KL936_002340 [Ogataea polymorpha]